MIVSKFIQIQGQCKNWVKEHGFKGSRQEQIIGRDFMKYSQRETEVAFN